MADLTFSGYHHALRRIVLTAMDLHWTARQDKTGITLKSPIDMKRVRIPKSKQVNSDRLRGMVNQVVTHSDPDVVADVALTIQALKDPDLDPEFANDLLQTFVPHEAADALGIPVPQAPGPITRRPYLAKKGRGTRYESESVEELVQDGVVVGYGCPECDFTADNHKSVAAHYRRTSAHHHPVDDGPVVAVVEEEATGYTPSDRLVRLLAHALAEAREGVDHLTDEDLARAALTFMHERPDLPEPEQRGPLTDSEILDRIRVLVVSDEVPVLRGEVAALQEKVTYFASEAEALQREHNDWRDRAVKAEGDLAALVELADSLKPKAS